MSSRTTTGAAPELTPPKSACAGDAVLHTSNRDTVRWDSVMGVIEDSISQCTFLQMTYTAENPHADGSAVPGARPRFLPPRRHDTHATSPAPTTTGWRGDRRPVISKRPLHSRAAAKMSPHIRICPEPVLTAHTPSPPSAGSHCPQEKIQLPIA
jgi:hypothetical protein